MFVSKQFDLVIRSGPLIHTCLFVLQIVVWLLWILESNLTWVPANLIFVYPPNVQNLLPIRTPWLYWNFNPGLQTAHGWYIRSYNARKTLCRFWWHFLHWFFCKEFTCAKIFAIPRWLFEGSTNRAWPSQPFLPNMKIAVPRVKMFTHERANRNVGRSEILGGDF